MIVPGDAGRRAVPRLARLTTVLVLVLVVASCSDSPDPDRGEDRAAVAREGAVASRSDVGEGQAAPRPRLLPPRDSQGLDRDPEAPEGVGCWTSSFTDTDRRFNWSLYAGSMGDCSGMVGIPDTPVLWFARQRRDDAERNQPSSPYIRVPRASGPLRIERGSPSRVRVTDPAGRTWVFDVGRADLSGPLA